MERRGVSVVGDHLWRSVNASIASSGGLEVSADTAMRLSAVWAAVGIQSETVGSLPLITYSRRSDGGKDRSPNSAWYDVLHDEPNPEMSSMAWREAQMLNLLLWGNAYSEIDQSAGVALLPLLSAYMRQERGRTGEVRYIYTEPGKSAEYRPDQLLRIPGRSINGVNGLSAIAYHRQSIGLGLAAQEFGARFFANDATPGFTLSTDQALPKEAVDRIKALWVESHQGLANVGAPAVLHSGLKPVVIGMPLADAQFLEQRKFQVTEIARIFGVPPHMIGDLDRSTNNNIEQQSIEYVVYHLRPWLVRWEQAIRQQLFTKAEKRRFFVEFLVDGLLRGDSAARHETYQKGMNSGYYSVNDILLMENRNPVPGGDRRFINGNMVPIDTVGDKAGAQKDGTPVSATNGGTNG